MGEAKLLERAFMTFAEAVSSLREHIATEADTDDPRAVLLGSLAMETLALWSSRIKALPKEEEEVILISPTGEILDSPVKAPARSSSAGGGLEGGELDRVVAVGIDAMTSLVSYDVRRCSAKLVKAGLLPPVIHCLRTSSVPVLQAAAACFVQNMAAIDTHKRRLLISSGAVRALQALLRRTNSPVAAVCACGAIQNLTIEQEFEAAVLDSGIVAELVAMCSLDPGTLSGDNPQVIQAAALALKNLAAGGEVPLMALSQARAAHAMSRLLELIKRRNRLTGVLETHISDTKTLVAAGGVLSAIATVQQLQGALWSSGALPNIPPLLQALFAEGWDTPRGEVIGAMVGVLQNACVGDAHGKARTLITSAQGGTCVARMVAAMVPKSLTPHEDVKASPSTNSLPRRTSSQKGGGEVISVRGAVLLDQLVGCVRNLAADSPEVQEQYGAAGGVEPLCLLLNYATGDKPTPWLSERLLVDSLFALANLCDECDANRTRLLAAGCMRAMLSLVADNNNKKTSGAACMLLQSVSANPRCRLKLVERDCIRLVFETLSRADVTPSQVSGCCGAVCNLAKTVGQLPKFMSMGGGGIVTRLCLEGRVPAAQKSVLYLIMLMASDDEYRKVLIEEGSVRATLQLLDTSRDPPASPMVQEVAAEALTVISQDAATKPHFHKIGAVAVLSAIGRFHTEKVQKLARMTLNRIKE